MTSKILFFTLLCCLSSFMTPCHAELYKYNELEIKGYDELLRSLRSKIEEATKLDEEARTDAGLDSQYDNSKPIFVLKEALRMVFSRPNKDNMVEKLLPEVRSELKSYGAYYDSINDIVVEAVNGLKQKIPVVYKSTYIFILENIMSEFRPEIKTNEEIRKIFIYIRDSGAVVPDDVRLDRKLRSMFNSRDPSDTAKAILDSDLPVDSKKEKKGFWKSLFG